MIGWENNDFTQAVILEAQMKGILTARDGPCDRNSQQGRNEGKIVPVMSRTIGFDKLIYEVGVAYQNWCMKWTRWVNALYYGMPIEAIFSPLLWNLY